MTNSFICYFLIRPPRIKNKYKENCFCNYYFVGRDGRKQFQQGRKNMDKVLEYININLYKIHKKDRNL